MKKAKNIVLSAVFGVMLSIASVFLISCGQGYKNLNISSDVSEVTIEKGETTSIKFTAENFGSSENGILSISVYDGSSTSIGEGESTHIAFTTSYNYDGVTTVVIEGKSGGESTIVATSNVGGLKTKTVKVNVKEYATEIAEKEGNLNYVTYDKDFLPSVNNYKFGESDTVTEKEVKFLYQENALSNIFEFTKVSFNEENNKIIFYNNDQEIFEKVIDKDLEKISFKAQYYISKEETKTIDSYFTVLYGFSPDSVKFNEASFTDEFEVNLVAEKAEGNEKSFIVDYSMLNNLDMSYRLTGEEYISLTKTKEDDGKYKFSFTNKTARESEATLEITLAYKGFEGVNLDGETVVSYTWKIPIKVLVKPTSIKVNGLENEAEYTVYKNNYSSGGWIELDVEILDKESTYKGYKITFEDTDLQIKNGNIPVKSGEVISNLKDPLYIRGKATSTVNTTLITLSVISDAIENNQDEVKNEVTINILKGATSLAFTDPDYEYSSTKEDNGIYVSNNKEKSEFYGIRANSQFNLFTMSHESGDDIVELLTTTDFCKEDNILNIQLKPKKVGVGTYIIKLDNGKSISATFRVIDELKDVVVEQYKSLDVNYNNVSEYVSKDSTLFLRELTGDNKSFATFTFTSANGQGAVKSIEYSGLQFVEIAQIAGQINEQKITYKSNGSGEITFTIKGYTVNDSNKRVQTEVNFTLDVKCYSLAKSIAIQDSGVTIKSAVLYCGDSVPSDESKKVLDIKLTDQVKAFGFYDNEKKDLSNYQSTLFDKKYVLWMSDKDITNVSNPSDESIYMKSGNVYRINDCAIFNPTTMEISAISAGVFNLTAVVMQYGSTQYYTISVSVSKYDQVETLSFEDKWTGLNDSVQFTDKYTEESFIVYVAGRENKKPTSTEIAVLTDVVGEGISVIDIDNIDITQLTELSYRVTVRRKEGGIVKTGLQFVAKSWLGANGQISEAYASKVIVIDVEYADGSETNPYRIDSAEDFENIQSNKHYTISKEINLSKETFFDFDFSGSIIGTNSTAKISGIETSKGLFKSISGSITNLAFSGKISGNVSGNVGLIAGTNTGALTNISVTLEGSALTCTGETNLGGLVGVNEGEIIQDFTKNDIPMISSITTVFMEGSINISVSSLAYEVLAGGIAGKNTGTIKKTPQSEYTRFNYEDYTAYTSFASESSNIYIGGIAGYSEGEISGALIGGKVIATNGTVGGIAGKISGMKLSGDIKVRTFIEGKNLGFIAGNGVGGEFADEGSHLIIQAIEAKDQNNETIPMFKRSESDSNVEDDVANNRAENIQKFVLVADRLSCGYELGQISFESYVEYPDHRDCVMGENNIYQFAKATQNTITPSTNSGFNEMKNESNEKMYYMYYFEASEYMRNGSFTSEDLTTAQDVLDKYLNKVKINSTLSPFKISLNDTRLTSSNTNILSVEGNYLVVHATGFVELNVSSLLNENNNAKIKILVVNYFDAKQSSSPLSVGNQGLGENVTISLYDRVSNVINISQKLNNVIKVDVEGEEKNIKIDENGILTLEGTVIKLSDKSQITTYVTCSDENKYVVWEIGEEQIILSRTGTPSCDATNTLTIKAMISYTVENKTYSCQIGNKVKLTIEYKQGATGIYSDRDVYIMDSSQTQKDVITLETDETGNNEGVIVKIYGDSYTDIVYELDNEEDSLFTVINTYDSTKKTCDITISVNKDSSSYKNRWKKNIFKDYTVRYLAKTTGEVNGIYKEVVLTLDNQSLNTVVVDNYNNINNLSTISKNVVPSQEGVLSMTIVPGDLDFQSIEVSNSSINSQSGSAKTTLRVGYLNEDQKFVALTKGVIYSEENHKVTITRDGIVDELNSFDGQLYISYIFANDASVVDGSTVGFDIKIIGKDDDEIYSDTITYQINKKFIFKVSLLNKEIQGDGYYVASGVRYELNVENNAFAEVEILSTNSGLGKIVKEDDKYYLEIESINDYSGDPTFDVEYSAWRLDLSGNKISTSGKFSAKVLKYVVNYKYDSTNNKNADIINGMENGKMSVAVGDKKTFALDFNDYAYLEYDSTNLAIVNEVMNFLNEARTKGIWNIYTNFTDLGVKKEGFAGSVSPNSHEKIYSLSENAKYVTEYFELDGYSFLPRKSQDSSEEINYMMIFEVWFSIENGGYSLTEPNTGNQPDYLKFKTEVLIDAYLRGSEESPNPITSYKDLKESMKNVGGYYILMNNITVSAKDFEPIAMSATSLDGNGYEIILSSGEYDIGDLEEVGFFSNIPSSSVLKNFTIRLSSGIQFKSNQTNSLDFGMLVSKNAGIITNSKVIGDVGGKLDLDFTTEPKNSGFTLAGLVAENSGKITNSRVEIAIESNISIAGVVGNNSGTVASSYYMGGVITNTSKEPVYFTSGFALNNSQYGRILTSYVSGLKEKGKVYADGEESRLISNVNVSAFIIENEGYIQDCYANIPVSTSASSFGFVMNNLKEIKNCFTTSKVQGTGAYSATNYYFAYQDTMGDNVGSFENCFYLSDSDINPSLAESEFIGVSELNKNGFSNVEDNFSSYSYVKSEQEGTSVWYYSETYKRLELTSANIESFSQKEQLADITDSNGNVIHQYKTISDDDGSESNPYLIYTPEQLENYLFGGRNKDSKCTAKAYYRLVGDINYLEYSAMTKLYNVTLAGILEGNGMVISGIEIVSDVSSEYSGLFSKIQGSSLKPAGVMNLTIIPTKVGFVNSYCVGTLAGLLKNANIANIKVYNNKVELDSGDDLGEKIEEGLIITGRNIVGGVVGYASDSYKASGIISLVGVKSNYIAQGNISSNVDISKASFAGSVIGFAGNGQGVIKDVKVQGFNSIAIAQNAGLVFGALGSGVKVDNVKVNMNEEMFLRAYSYGGIIAGYSYADLSNIYIKGTETDLELFKLVPYVPSAVGGVAGRICRGSLENIYMGQSFSVSEKTSVSGSVQGVSNVGGIAGQVDSRTIEIANIIVDANISTRRNLGGIIGYIDSAIVKMENIAIHKSTLTVSGRNATPKVGGFVASVSETAKLEIKDAYSQANILVDTYMYGVSASAYTGAIVAVCDGTYSFENIYTTTTYDVTISDNSSNLSASPVGYTRNYDENKNKYIWKEISGRNINFDLKANKVNDVYFFMENYSEDSTDQFHYKMDSILGQDGTTYFKVKYNDKEINLHQNEYGISLGEYKGYTYASPVERKDYYALFESEEAWESGQGSLSTLKFETELLSKIK